jgi:GNAT superfamily N-acetyltransferase
MVQNVMKNNSLTKAHSEESILITPMAPIVPMTPIASIRAIKSRQDLKALADFSSIHQNYLLDNDITGLPMSLQAAKEWVASSSHEYWRRRRVFGAFMADGACIGFCCWTPLTRAGNLAYAVDPRFQGLGIGRMLLSHATKRARKITGAGVSLNLLVCVENTNSIRLAQACGFQMAEDKSRRITMQFGRIKRKRDFIFMDYSHSSSRQLPNELVEPIGNIQVESRTKSSQYQPELQLA